MRGKKLIFSAHLFKRTARDNLPIPVAVILDRWRVQKSRAHPKRKPMKEEKILNQSGPGYPMGVFVVTAIIEVTGDIIIARETTPREKKTLKVKTPMGISITMYNREV